MAPLDVVVSSLVDCTFDAALPQAGALGKKTCQSGHLSAIVHAGRTQAVCTSKWGRACCVTLQEHRSRGCRAPKSFCRSAWLPSWQLAAAAIMKKSSTWKNPLFRSSRPTPANTSKTKGRAEGAIAPRPALFLSGASADNPACSTDRFATDLGRSYARATATLFHWRFSCGQLQSLPCWPLLALPPAPNRPQNPNQCLSPSNPPRPANTVPDFPERARRGARPAPVRSPMRAPEQKVRPC